MVKKKWLQLRTGDVFFIDKYKYIVEESRRGTVKILKYENNVLVDYATEEKNNTKIYYVMYNMINRHHKVEMPISYPDFWDKICKKSLFV